MVRKLGSFLRAYGKQFTSFERVKAEYTPRSPGLADMLYEVLALGRMKASRFAKKRLR
jgi:hypothetical protein